MADKPERVEHVEAKDAIDRFEDLARRAQRVAVRGYIQAQRAYDKLARHEGHHKVKVSRGNGKKSGD
jgi:hypothetical protein